MASLREWNEALDRQTTCLAATCTSVCQLQNLLEQRRSAKPDPNICLSLEDLSFVISIPETKQPCTSLRNETLSVTAYHGKYFV